MNPFVITSDSTVATLTISDGKDDRDGKPTLRFTLTTDTRNLGQVVSYMDVKTKGVAILRNVLSWWLVKHHET